MASTGQDQPSSDSSDNCLEMTPAQFMRERANAQIKFYDSIGRNSSVIYGGLQCMQLVLAALITLLSGHVHSTREFAGLNCSSIIGISGALIAICGGINSLFSIQKTWLTFTNTAESMKNEKYLYMSKCKPYNIKDAGERHCLFVSRIEDLDIQTTKNWVSSLERSASHHV